ncbi:alpha/beta fold hydrolase [Psychroserpens sp. SPM9]|uniref:alpha/beta fold hydrolase n=1 Tax=Psychroserpens sp. SPM9 TaxID=2975598 RepID=UPI0021A274D6|nr:alpha/beta hydrolase [Psychroserpens sp. SPM9]MDG5492906.1 alpha/beta hydrolase [Psychroserpens sp. SPM9]
MTDLHFKKQGKGEPVVLIHGGGTDSRDWNLIASNLEQKFSVITYDLRGMGKSPVPKEKTNHVADLEILLDSLSINKAILVGHSLGGQIATDFALTKPEKVKKLILIAPGLTGFEFDASYQEMINKIWNVVPDSSKMLDIMLNSPNNYAVQESLKSSHKETIVQIHRENIEKSLSWKNFEQEWPEPSSINQLTDLKTEALFILGNEDKKDLFEIKNKFKKAKNIEFEIIKKADHLIIWTHPQQISELIVKFSRK